jgi:hypothetical protein
MKSTYCEYILEKILLTSEVGPILALIQHTIQYSTQNSIFSTLNNVQNFKVKYLTHGNRSQVKVNLQN